VPSQTGAGADVPGPGTVHVWRARLDCAAHVLEEFRQAYRAGEALYLRHDMHFGERGHSWFARAIMRQLEAAAPAARGR